MRRVTEIASMLCDDIRVEVGRKISLMGVYGSSVRSKGAEAIFPRLHLFKRVSSDDGGTYTATLDLLGPSGASVLSKNEPPKLEGVKLGQEVNFGLGVGPLRLAEAGKYEMRLTLSAPDKENIVLSHPFSLELNHAGPVE